MVLEALYDVGYRSGEILFMADTGSLSILLGIPEPYATKRLELIKGSLVFSYREYVGDFGEIIKNEIQQLYKEITYMCLTFDTVSVFKNSINYLIGKGGDFEDYGQMMRTIRMNRFIGCLGNVFFDTNGNTRSSAQILIQQIYYNKTENSLRTIDVAYYDRFSSILINQITDYKWSTGKKPKNFIEMSKCGFYEKDNRESSSGKTVLYWLCAGLFLSTLISCSFSFYFYFKKDNHEPTKAITSFDDIKCYLYFYLEFFQFVAMGPDQEVLKKIFNNFALLVSFEINEFFSFEFEKFWNLFYFILTICIFWVLLALLKLLKFQNLLSQEIKGRFEYLSNLYLEIFGHQLFIPTLSIVLNIFLCNRATDNNLTSSYLNYDCRENCYEGHHKNFAILAYIVLIFYILLSVFLRPIYQEDSFSLHIFTKSSFIILESLIQVILVILNKSLKFYNQMIHGVICCVILALFLVFTYFYSPYNIKRPWITHLGLIAASAWAILLSAIFNEVQNFEILLIVQILGLLMILVITMYFFKKAPEDLISEKGINVSKLFMFQFSLVQVTTFNELTNSKSCIEDKYAISEDPRS